MKKQLAAAVLSLSAVLSAGSMEKILHVDFEDIKAKKDALHQKTVPYDSKRD